jgi:N4-(beta-N-acetylglucosaminyl)-L-asparaginase
MNKFDRRDFLKTSALVGTGALISGNFSETLPQKSTQGSFKPIVIASANGPNAVKKAMELIKNGADALDGVLAGVNIVEDDPNDDSVGYGGLPNEEGVVELDAAVMHGPSYRAGAVAAIQNIKNPSQVARVVMERSDHVLIVGGGALKFAKAHGFKEENLLTDESREKWLKWKENLSREDDWLPPHTLEDTDIGEYMKSYLRHYGTIHCSALDMNGNLSCVTTTSGLAYKIPGRVGDSPIIGAGLYCDNEVGSAGSTGRGEANLLNCSSVLIVEWMRQGKSPEEACLSACKRVNERVREKRLLDSKGRFKNNVKFYAINKRGEFGSAAIWGAEGINKPKFVIHDGESAKTLEGAYLFTIGK